MNKKLTLCIAILYSQTIYTFDIKTFLGTVAGCACVVLITKKIESTSYLRANQTPQPVKFIYTDKQYFKDHFEEHDDTNEYIITK